MLFTFSPRAAGFECGGGLSGVGRWIVDAFDPTIATESPRRPYLVSGGTFASFGSVVSGPIQHAPLGWGRLAGDFLGAAISARLL